MRSVVKGAALAAAIVPAVLADSLETISHVVLFMQENRAFDHYYGTLSGVRGYKDPNVLVNDGVPVWYQPVTGQTSKFLLPWWVSQQSSFAESNQCMEAGSNDWSPNHNAWDDGKIDRWAEDNTPYSWGGMRRSDIPALFDIVEGWTIADMYAEGVIGPTNPNRVTWISGRINVESDFGQGPYIENVETPGCTTSSDGEIYDCYPVNWETTPEILEANGIDWFVFQDTDNFDDNPLAWFKNFQEANATSPLAQKGVSFSGLDDFYERAANGTLPAVSYIVGPEELSEHPPNRPVDGSWLQKQVVDAVTSSPLYNETVLIISYDETGGWGDHVPPFVAPNGTAGQWLKDPENPSHEVPSGPGFRVPMYVISPWTRGGNVFTAPSDHNSQIKFVEEWVKAKFNKDITSPVMSTWRRQFMSDLTDMFDFDHPDYSTPSISNVDAPPMQGSSFLQPRMCEEQFGGAQPPIPYGQQTIEDSLSTEQGSKQIRGALTEGRYLVFVSTDNFRSFSVGSRGQPNLDITSAPKDLTDLNARFIVHQQGDPFSTLFKIQSANGPYLTETGLTLDSNRATVFEITFEAGSGYTVSPQNTGLFFDISGGSRNNRNQKSFYNIFSVSYGDPLSDFQLAANTSNTAISPSFLSSSNV